MTEEQIRFAYHFWLPHYRHPRADRSLNPVLEREAIESSDILKLARDALLLTMETVAQRLRISRVAYCKMEKRPANGSIRIKTLQRAADAMDCDLYFLIRPKDEKLFAETVFKNILDSALAHRWVTSRPEHLKPNALAAAVR